MSRASLPAELTFLAEPGEAADWRVTILYDTAQQAGLIDALPGTADELAAKLGLDASGTRVVLDALGAWGIVGCQADGTYIAGAGAPDSNGAASLRHHARAIRRWAGSLDKQLRGESVENTGVGDPESFLKALAINARRGAAAIVDQCLARFPDARSVIDLGGGHGEYALEFARRGLRATMQDRPQMIDVVRREGRLEEAGVELFEGDFFEVVPDGPFDLAFCSGITHTFDGDHNLMLFGRLRPVVSQEGGVAVVTFLRGRHPLGAVFAVQMFVNGNGGDTHTEDEYRDWLKASGFTVDDAVVDLADRPRSILFAT